MGFFRPPTPATPDIPKGPSAKEVRAQEEARIRGEQRSALVAQESRRAKLRSQLGGEEDEDEVIRKRLFGE